MDDNYKTYLNRLARMMLPETYKSQVQYIQESFKFQPQPEGGRKAVPFPGYTVITPPAEDESTNSTFYSRLLSCQEQLLQLAIASNLIVPVPASSFHLTLADLIWESAYQDAIAQNPDYEAQLCACFARIFGQYSAAKMVTQPIRWQMLGLVVMPRAVGVCLVPQNEDSYHQIVEFRRMIYQNPEVIALAIEQHYHFTAHVTLGYFGHVSPDLDKERLSSIFSDLNQQWLENTPEFLIHRAELRKFDDMTRYYRKPDYPVLDF